MSTVVSNTSQRRSTRRHEYPTVHGRHNDMNAIPSNSTNHAWPTWNGNRTKQSWNGNGRWKIRERNQTKSYVCGTERTNVPTRQERTKGWVFVGRPTDGKRHERKTIARPRASGTNAPAHGDEDARRKRYYEYYPPAGSEIKVGPPASTSSPPSFNGFGETGILYPKPGWGIGQYPKPKTGVVRASRTVLLLTQLFHFLTAGALISVAYAIHQSFQHLHTVLPLGSLSVFFLLLTPVWHMVSLFVTIVMHDYEGWQIAPYQAPPLNRKLLNNDALRHCVYRLQYLCECIAKVMLITAVYGFTWTLGTVVLLPVVVVPLLAGLLAWLHASPRHSTVSFLTPSWKGTGERWPVLPISISMWVPFTVLFVAYCCGMGSLLGAHAAANVIALTVIIPIVLDQVMAESTFNQLFHLASNMFACAGYSMWHYFLMLDSGAPCEWMFEWMSIELSWLLMGAATVTLVIALKDLAHSGIKQVEAKMHIE